MDFSATSKDEVESLKSCVDKLVATSYNRTNIKSAVAAFMTRVFGNVHEIEVLRYSLTVMKPLLSQCEEEDLRIRLRSADLYQEAEEYHKAAEVLQEALLLHRDTTSSEKEKRISNEDKFELYIRIIRCYLEAEESENAAAIITMAQYLRPSLTDLTPSLDIHFKLSQARVYDSSRKFLEASSKYYQVSRESSVDDYDRLASLRQAIVCGVLSPAGLQRSAVLRMLYNDERSQEVQGGLYGVLEKSYLDRLLSNDDVIALTKACSEHQLASLPDGTTVLNRALIDHNVLSISKICKNIDLSTLAKLLGLDHADKAEEYVTKMVVQNRLKAKIDDTTGFIYFRSDLEGSGGLTTDYREDSSNHLVLLKEDEKWREMFGQLNDIVAVLP